MRGRRLIRAIARQGVVERSVRALAGQVPRRRDVLAVLTFHRVAPHAGAVPGLLSATPDGFSHLLDVVLDTFAVVSIDDVLARRAGGPRLPARSLLLTIDDGYEDIAVYAWPALAERGLPGIMFVPTAFPGGPGRPTTSFWWERAWAAIRDSAEPSIVVSGVLHPLTNDHERAAAYRAVRSWLKELPHEELEAAVAAIERAAGFDAGHLPPPTGRPLDWDGLRRLQAEGLALASHTRTHPLLTRVEGDTLRDEIRGGIEDLERETGSRIPAFAFPSGALHGAADAALIDAGIQVAFSTRRGVNDLRDARWLELRRVNVSISTPTSAVLAQAVR